MSSSPDAGALPYTSYLDAIGEEADRLRHAAERGLDAAVPTCPGWDARDLVEHVAAVYRHWSTQVGAADPDHRTPVNGGDAAGGEVDPAVGGVLSELEHEATVLLGALEQAGPESPCWNWSGTDLVAGWVARRMALETAVHRFDGEHASGKATPVERELALDGVNERLDVHLRVALRAARDASLGGSVCLVCSDADASWVVDVAAGRLRWRRGRGPADAVLVGTASDLLLFVWNRVDLDVLALTGRREVALGWRTLPT